MTSTARRDRAIARSLIAAGLGALVNGLAIAAAAHADSPPVGPLSAGPVSTITTSPNQLVAVALPHASRQFRLEDRPALRLSHRPPNLGSRRWRERRSCLQGCRERQHLARLRGHAWRHIGEGVQGCHAKDPLCLSCGDGVARRRRRATMSSQLVRFRSTFAKSPGPRLDSSCGASQVTPSTPQAIAHLPCAPIGNWSQPVATALA
jgi:hypothetical protein